MYAYQHTQSIESRHLERMMSEGLSSEEKWHNWYSTALFLYNAYLSAHIEHRESPLREESGLDTD